MDRVDQLIDILNRDVSGVVFDRDAIDVDRPEDWGAVELRPDAKQQWADGHLVGEAHRLDVYLCVSDREADWAEKVNSAFLAFDDEVDDIGWQLADRGYLPELDRILWRWSVTLFGPLACAR